MPTANSAVADTNLSDTLFDIAPLADVPVIESPTGAAFAQQWEDTREPVILRPAHPSRQAREWSLEAFRERLGDVPTQRPDGSSVNVFSRYETVSFGQFIDEMGAGEGHRYIGATPVLGSKGRPLPDSPFAPLADDIELPPFFGRDRLSTANLWIGGGDNYTLLHFDPWHSIMELLTGTKQFAIFPAAATAAMDPRPLIHPGEQGGALDSRINGRQVQPKYRDRLAKTHGYRATVHAGEMLFVPAGYWHYVESTGLNIGLNFFFHSRSLHTHLTRPVINWRLRYSMMAPIRAARRVRRSIPDPIKRVLRRA